MRGINMSKRKGMDLYEEDQYADDLEEDEFAEESDEENVGEPDEIEESEEGGEDVRADEADAETDGESEEDELQERAKENEDEQPEDAEDGYTDEKSAKRIARRKRRIRNQIIAYIVMLVFTVGLIWGAVFAGKQLIKFVDSRKSPEPVQEDDPPDDPIVVGTPEPTLEPEPTPEVNPVDEVARYYIDQMTLEEKVAGLFFVTPESMMEGISQATVAGAKTREALDQYAVGGIIYFKKNIQSKDQLTKLLAGTEEMSRYPLFLGVDEEGGSVARVADALSGVNNTGHASKIGASGDATQAYNAYYEIGSYLTRLGFNVDFAPVADLYDGENAMFKDRSFGTDADIVKTFVYQAVCGLQDNGVSACLKHFPGHGRTGADSHNGMAVSGATKEELLAYDIVPFEMALSANPDFVMMGHISLPNVLGDNTPASMSSDIVTGILRDQLGYDGIVITDALNMSAVSDYYTSAEAAVNVIQAGCDMILMPDDFKEAYQGVIDAVGRGEISMERIEESLLRIYRVKCAGMTLSDLTGAAGGDDEGEEE